MSHHLGVWSKKKPYLCRPLTLPGYTGFIPSPPASWLGRSPHTHGTGRTPCRPSAPRNRRCGKSHLSSPRKGPAWECPCLHLPNFSNTLTRTSTLGFPEPHSFGVNHFSGQPLLGSLIAPSPGSISFIFFSSWEKALQL